MNLSEKEFVDVLFQAHEKIKKLIAWQKEIQQELGYRRYCCQMMYMVWISGKIR